MIGRGIEQGGLMKAIVVLFACAVSACAAQPQGTWDPKLSELSSQINGLSEQMATKDAEISALALRVSELEAARAEQAALVARIAATQTTAPEVGAPWVAWFKETPINPHLLMGYKPDTPQGAFETRAECIDAIRKAVNANKGDPDQGSYIVDMGQYMQRNSYACLPNGTDPRIKR
jgi:hypothetical protein